ncbi:hypothetical protein [Zavarzinia sp. CC-PAN008]|uniref:hypothetical protein n=1 Tax=Zavarzinia sp. CC-PAN008 TaxID=3243332 RepID=UPI003F748471
MDINKIMKLFLLTLAVVLLAGTAILFYAGGQTCVTRGYRAMGDSGSLVVGWDAYNRCQVSGGVY